MAKFVAYLALTCLFFLLLAPTEMQGVEGNICTRKSQTWSGYCGDSGQCGDQCRDKEGAASGACATDGWPGPACLCYFKC